jgi:hypothetical protein
MKTRTLVTPALCGLATVLLMSCTEQAPLQHSVSASDTNPLVEALADEAARKDGTVLHTLMGSTESRFATVEEYQDALARCASELADDGRARDAIGSESEELIDRISPTMIYALYKLGHVRVGDHTVLSDSVLLANAHNRSTGKEGLAKATSNPPSFVQQNQGPYKMQGETFTHDYYVYNDIGAYTQFKKHRRKWWYTGWWDTDASRISIRCIYFANPDAYYYGYPYGWTSYAGYANSKSTSNNDYISTASVSFGAKVSIDFGVDPYSTSYNMPKSYTADNYDAVMAYHAVDHAGYQWRLQTSQGMRGRIVWGNYYGSYRTDW